MLYYVSIVADFRKATEDSIQWYFQVYSNELVTDRHLQEKNKAILFCVRKLSVKNIK